MWKPQASSTSDRASSLVSSDGSECVTPSTSTISFPSSVHEIDDVSIDRSAGGEISTAPTADCAAPAKALASALVCDERRFRALALNLSIPLTRLLRSRPLPGGERYSTAVAASMTTRIDARFAELKKQGRAAFVTFLMAGDPDPATSLAIIKALPKAGADIIEIGMPFTDPMADGPAIQAAGLRALKAGMTLKKTLAMVREFRDGDAATPLVLMGYYNPIYIYGVDKFLADAKSAGVDGLIVVDLPPEMDE